MLHLCYNYAGNILLINYVLFSEALARNTFFPKPQIPELQEAVTEGLRNAKQRVRNKEKENEKREKEKKRLLLEKLKENLNMLNE